MTVNNIIETITIAKFDNGQVREIKAKVWLGTANIIDKPFNGLHWATRKKDYEQVNTNPEDVIRIIAAYFGFNEYDLKRKSRMGLIVPSRQCCVYFLRIKTQLSYKAIGKYFGQDHSSAVHGVEVVNDLMDAGDRMKDWVIELSGKLSQFPDINPPPANSTSFRKRMGVKRAPLP